MEMAAVKKFSPDLYTTLHHRGGEYLEPATQTGPYSNESIASGCPPSALLLKH
jgi:hypothetical protein